MDNIHLKLNVLVLEQIFLKLNSSTRRALACVDKFSCLAYRKFKRDYKLFYVGIIEKYCYLRYNYKCVDHIYPLIEPLKFKNPLDIFNRNSIFKHNIYSSVLDGRKQIGQEIFYSKVNYKNLNTFIFYKLKKHQFSQIITNNTILLNMFDFIRCIKVECKNKIKSLMLITNDQEIIIKKIINDKIDKKSYDSKVDTPTFKTIALDLNLFNGCLLYNNLYFNVEFENKENNILNDDCEIEIIGTYFPSIMRNELYGQNILINKYWYIRNCMLYNSIVI